MSELRGRCRHCDGYYCDNVGGCPVHEVVEAQATMPMVTAEMGTLFKSKEALEQHFASGTSLRELNDLQSAKYNLMQSQYEALYQQAAATFYCTYPTIVGGV